ncbi:MAG: hypothetical protein PHU42_02720 [Patescibacteria group bacterium]|nr:hypothetical protein [Patescibacteria group bacterium]
MNQFETMKGPEYDPGKVLTENLEKVKAEYPELGKNVEITIEIARHGEKTSKGALSSEGAKQAAELGRTFPEGIDRTIGYGSSLEQGGTRRALDTVKIALENAPEVKSMGLAEIERIGEDLDFKKLKNPWPSQPNKDAAAKGKEMGWDSHKIDTVGMNETFKISPESLRETASKFAHIIKFLFNSASISKNGEKIFYPVIAHGMGSESLLKLALTRTNKETGEKILGFDSLEEIGGAFVSTEAVDLLTKTDENKNITNIEVNFKDPARRKLLEGYDLSIDMAKIEELDAAYEKYQ